MGLFGKKDPCAICGGKVKALLPWRVDGQLVCNSCFRHVDLPIERVNSMTMDEFRTYMAFRAENEQLKQQFKVIQKVDFGAFEDKLVFDTDNHLFCMKDSLESTIFEGRHIKSFSILEDNEPLFTGNAAGLVCYASTVPDRLAAMTPVIQQMAMMTEMKRDMERMAKDSGKQFDSYSCNSDVQEPFQKFVVEIQCDHPYLPMLTAEKKGPTFNNDRPSAQEYLREYQQGIETMSQLARALMAVAFPGAPEQRVGRNVAVVIGQTGSAPVAAPAASVDAVAEIQRFKALVEQGILTEEEFAAKKRQLLGI